MIDDDVHLWRDRCDEYRRQCERFAADLIEANDRARRATERIDAIGKEVVLLHDSAAKAGADLDPQWVEPALRWLRGIAEEGGE